MGEVVRKVEQSEMLLALVGEKASMCFLCRWISEDVKQHKKLTGWPLDSMSKGIFPVEGKLVHVLLELGAELPSDPENLDDLASTVARALENERSW